MPFYDFKSKNSRTALGQRIVERTTDKVFKIIQPYLKDGFYILDIGAGNGEFAERCINNNYNYSAIEINETYKQKLLSIGVQVISASVPPIPCKENSYDYVHLSHLLEHMSSYDKALELISEIYRVLKPSGYVCIMSPDYLSSHKFFYDGDYTHSFVTTENRVRMLLDDAGFKIVFAKGFAGGMIGWKAAVAGFFGKLYNNYFYWWVQALLKVKINPVKLGRTRGVFARFIFILAQKV